MAFTSERIEALAPVKSCVACSLTPDEFIAAVPAAPPAASPGVSAGFKVPSDRKNKEKTKWRWMQSVANCSLQSIPDIREKYWEFSRLSSGGLHWKCLYPYVLRTFSSL